MTHHGFTVPAYLTGRLDTPQESANSLAFDLTNVHLHDEDDLALEVLVEQPRRIGCATVEIRDDRGRCYGRSRVAPAAGPIRVRLNAAATADVRLASGGFFGFDAVFTDAEGAHQSFTLGTGHVALLTITRQESCATAVLTGAA